MSLTRTEEVTTWSPNVHGVEVSRRTIDLVLWCFCLFNVGT